MYLYSCTDQKIVIQTVTTVHPADFKCSLNLVVLCYQLSAYLPILESSELKKKLNGILSIIYVRELYLG